MNYWLVKSEPYVYSFDQLIKDKQTIWDGVRNYTARNYLRDMKQGDQVFYYHSNDGMEIVGIAEVVKASFPDPTADNPAWVSVILKPVKQLLNPVSLKRIKAEPALSEMQLVTNSRLSVQKVTLQQWRTILKMASS